MRTCLVGTVAVIYTCNKRLVLILVIFVVLGRTWTRLSDPPAALPNLLGDAKGRRSQAKPKALSRQHE